MTSLFSLPLRGRRQGVIGKYRPLASEQLQQRCPGAIFDHMNIAATRSGAAMKQFVSHALEIRRSVQLAAKLGHVIRRLVRRGRDQSVNPACRELVVGVLAQPSASKRATQQPTPHSFLDPSLVGALLNAFRQWNC